MGVLPEIRNLGHKNQLTTIKGDEKKKLKIQLDTKLWFLTTFAGYRESGEQRAALLSVKSYSHILFSFTIKLFGWKYAFSSTHKAVIIYILISITI